MVLVDSSVWLTALNSAESNSYRARIQLEELLGNYLVSVCDAIRFDVLHRIGTEKRAEFLSYFNQLPVLPVKASTWNIAIQIAWELQATGTVIRQGEAVVVALALQNQMPLFTYSTAQISVNKTRRLKLVQ